jgi:hypothetical protein
MHHAFEDSVSFCNHMFDGFGDAVEGAHHYGLADFLLPVAVAIFFFLWILSLAIVDVGRMVAVATIACLFVKFCKKAAGYVPFFLAKLGNFLLFGFGQSFQMGHSVNATVCKCQYAHFPASFQSSRHVISVHGWLPFLLP